MPDCPAGSATVMIPAADHAGVDKDRWPLRPVPLRPAATGSPRQARSWAISGMPQAWTSRSTSAVQRRREAVERHLGRISANERA